MKMTLPKAWLILFGLQIVLIGVIFFSFLSGQFYFAYMDIGSDTFGQFAPSAMNLARTLAREGFTGWSFVSGLGSSTALWLGDVFSLLGLLGGPDGVLPLRIWVHVLKMVLGGAAFFVLIRCYVTRWETMVISALAYSFCGFIVINGQWDSEGTGLILFPLILWAITRTLRSGNVLALPVVLAISLVSGVFFVSLAIFLMLACLAFVLTSPEPKVMFKLWLLRILPLTVLGFLLAAPVLLPIMFQLMDGSRVGGGQNLFKDSVAQSLRFNEWSLIAAEIGGLFHKDIFGIGSNYRGYWNYLEGPGFYIGIFLFLVIPQLWQGTAAERKAMLLGLAAVAAYFVFPVFRIAAMGFAAPYFRISTLWVSLLLLMLAAKALDQVLSKGVNGRLLVIGAGVFGLLLALVLMSLGAKVWQPHVYKVIGLALLALVLLLLAQRQVLSARVLPFLLMGLVAVETVLIAQPSYLNGRAIITPQQNPYKNDGTLQALRDIRNIDKGVFRIEKTYHSVSLADALAQDYMGVKSYFFHSRGVVDFYVGLGLIPPPQAAGAVNYTNWLPNMGQRFMLNSLLGVKYLVSRAVLQWPGYVAVGQGSNYIIYRNDMALPLGVVHTRQITPSTFAKLATRPEQEANIYRDIVMMNAVVLDQPVPNHGELFDLDGLVSSNALTLQDNYYQPALALQATGLRLEQFASNHLKGSISPEKNGVLVFSIPFNQGWSLQIDGQPTPLMRANFGMLAAPVAAGTHTVALDFRMPGQRVGAMLGLLGLGLLLLLGVKRWRH
ncbi:MAG: YfhO family protein [Rhodoferax sp.]|uniref:YfhO family protein n=1 Tax=Rhodoferax sp. TaxID=50421 RepID=UPI00262DB0D8|nr:YfhO family protein [Rhodoferax sp.]MDD2882891.1 YfhO family protein [Rhodoferax sp.]